jgi:hypothetical protein
VSESLGVVLVALVLLLRSVRVIVVLALRL